MGVLPEVLPKHPKAKRSSHPINHSQASAQMRSLIRKYLQSTSPIGAGEPGWLGAVAGVDHRVNTSIHYAEKHGGRLQFIRWALLQDRVVECPGFPEIQKVSTPLRLL